MFVFVNFSFLFEACSSTLSHGSALFGLCRRWLFQMWYDFVIEISVVILGIKVLNYAQIHWIKNSVVTIWRSTSTVLRRSKHSSFIGALFISTAISELKYTWSTFTKRSIIISNSLFVFINLFLQKLNQFTLNLIFNSIKWHSPIDRILQLFGLTLDICILFFNFFL